MGKILLWIVVIFALLFVLRMLSVAKMRREQTPPERDKSRVDEEPGPMVRCADCGVFLPRADARPSPQGFGCGDPHCAHRGGAAS